MIKNECCHIDNHSDVPSMDGEEGIEITEHFHLEENDNEHRLIEGIQEKQIVHEDGKQIAKYSYREILRTSIGKSKEG
jgi:hypothetical protein